MSWSSDHLPKYRKHRASCQALVSLGGRGHHLGTHGTKASRREYDRLIVEYLASGRSPSFGAASHEVFVVELAADYLRCMNGYYGTGKSSKYHRFLPILKPLKELYGRTPCGRLWPLQLKALREQFIAVGWSRTYINANIRRLVRLFRRAAPAHKASAKLTVINR